ncbi:hypothetical protein KBT16_11785 [Nostoc sp. CCCryo 231-06]|nr:hypothetical protein [Nostoc sp. CCCryo 231-06]
MHWALGIGHWALGIWHLAFGTYTERCRWRSLSKSCIGDWGLGIGDWAEAKT